MVNSSTLEREAVRSLSSPVPSVAAACQVAAIWIDWHAHHVARFQGMLRHPELAGSVAGIELVDGVGLRAGAELRDKLPASLPVDTLLLTSRWSAAGKWRLCAEIWRQLTLLNPSVVLVPGSNTAPALAAALWAKCKGKLSVLMTEGIPNNRPRKWLGKTSRKLLVNTLFDWAVAGGKPHHRYLKQLGFPPDRLAGCYDVVDNAFFNQCCRDIRATRQPGDFGLPQNYFLYVGRMTPDKGATLLLAEYLRYRAAGGVAALVLVGDGPDLKKIHAMAANTPFAADVYLPGKKVTSELPKYYAFASAFILASTREPWGLVVNEAMASELPVLVSNRCGCAEDLVIEGENGLTFDPTSQLSLTACLQRFERLGLERRRQMGHRSYEIVSRFSPDTFAGEIHRIVNSRR